MKSYDDWKNAAAGEGFEDDAEYLAMIEQAEYEDRIAEMDAAFEKYDSFDEVTR